MANPPPITVTVNAPTTSIAVIPTRVVTQSIQGPAGPPTKVGPLADRPADPGGVAAKGTGWLVDDASPPILTIWNGSAWVVASSPATPDGVTIAGAGTVASPLKVPNGAIADAQLAPANRAASFDAAGLAATALASANTHTDTKLPSTTPLDATGATDGQAMVYDQASGKFKPGTVAGGVLGNGRYGTAFGVPIVGSITIPSSASPHAIIDTAGKTAAQPALLPLLSTITQDGTVVHVTHASRGAVHNIAVKPQAPDTLQNGAVPAQVLGPSTQGYWVADKVLGTWWRLDTDRSRANVHDFGAYGDGAHDDTAAIQAAITSLSFVGGVVFIPQSVAPYMISSVLLLDSFSGAKLFDNVELRGGGYASCIKASVPIGTSHGNGLAMIETINPFGTSNERIGLRDLRISGYDEHDNGAGPLVAFNGCNKSYVIGCFIDTTRNEGVYWSGTGCKDATVENNYATRVGGWGSADGSDFRAAYNINVSNVTLRNNRAFQVGMAVEHVGAGGVICDNYFDSCGLQSGAIQAPGMSLESTGVGARLIIRHNTVLNAANGVGIGSGQHGECIVEGNVIENCNSGVVLDNTTSPSIIRNNYFYDSAGAANGAAIEHGGSSAPVVIEGNMIVQGPTQRWAYAIYLAEPSTADLVRGNTVVGNATTTAVFNVTSGNTTAELYDNRVIPIGTNGTMADAMPRYNWQGRLFTKGTNGGAQVLAGIDADVVLSTARPSSVRHSAAPTAGTWSVGDVVVNTAPAASGNMGWVCTTAGTPGVWKTFGQVAA